jgi:leader peptidase (prepilin peptidase) / N-methyltransferase
MYLVVAALFGVLFGNFATTYYHRLPLKKPINGYNKKKGQKPHCSKCGHHLKFYEYFPVFSWIFVRGKCNYCGVKIDPVYTMLEFSTMLFAIALYLAIGINLVYPTALLLGCAITLSIILYHTHKKFYRQVVYASVLLAGIIFLQLYYDIT